MSASGPQVVARQPFPIAWKRKSHAHKMFTTQAFIEDSADLLNLAAPGSLVRRKDGLGVVKDRLSPVDSHVGP